MTGMSEYERNQFEDIEARLGQDSGFVGVIQNIEAESESARVAYARAGLAGQLKQAPESQPEVRRVPGRRARMVAAGLVAASLAIGGVIATKVQEADNEKRLVRKGVEFALGDAEILKITGTCGLELRKRAKQVDAIIHQGDNSDRNLYGIGPSGDQLRQAGTLADDHDVPCQSTLDGAYTFTIQNQPVTIQETDILWQSPSPR